MKSVAKYKVAVLVASCGAIVLACLANLYFMRKWFEATGQVDLSGMFSYLAALSALVAIGRYAFVSKERKAAEAYIKVRDLAIDLREEALNEHTIVSISGPDGRIRGVNRNWEETFGFTPQEAIGASAGLVYCDDKQEDFRAVRDKVSRGETWKGRQRLMAKDGRRVTVQTTILPRFHEDGTLADNISIRTDLSRAFAEGATEGRNAVVESLPDEVYIYDPETFQLKYVNEIGRRRIRVSVDNVGDHNLLDYFTENERALYKRYIAPVLTGERTSARIEIDHATGPVEILTHLDVDSSGTKSLVSVLRDTSERKMAEQIKLSSVSTVSHELRTPLTSIKGALRLLDSGVVGELAPDASHLVSVAHRNSERLLAIVNDILTLEKLSSGEMPISTEPMDLRDLLAESVEANANFASECGVRLVIDRFDEHAIVEADSARLVQVMSNLISNAAKFSPEGSGVTLRIEDRGDLWRVCVQDTGPGIPEKARKTIFDSFTQVEGTKSESHPGTGLGLTISKKIIDRHGGVLDFETEVGRGTTFYFDLQKGTEVPFEGQSTAVA